MLVFDDLSLRRGPELLIGGLSLSIHPGWKVGLTGANGTGKSSLFALILGELPADGGSFQRPARWVIAQVEQETPAVSQSAIDYVLDGDTELRQIQAGLAQAEADDDGNALGRLHADLESIDGYTATSRAARLMHGLGFRAHQEHLPVRDFSGGWRMRLNLAKALMCRSDLLLLDEPTNHLDIDAVLWLEEWLASYQGTLLLISHDRDFLDRVVNHIAHVEHRELNLYPGNYSDFERQRAERLSQQASARVRQERERAHIQSFVDRFRAKATKAKQAQSRLKQLERMELIAPAHIDAPFHFGFQPPDRLPDPLVMLEKLSVGYNGMPVLSGLNLRLSPGDRIGLLGVNGAGKSTLVRALVGELDAMQGEREANPGLVSGYFAQHQLEQLDVEAGALLHMQRLDPRLSEQQGRNFLGGFGFSGDQVDSPVGNFSGGEKARLVLAMLVHRRPNLLLLDEPTNHLDIEMRHALSLALQEYEGALLVVSHDRHLLTTVCDRWLLVSDGRVRDFDGDLDDYRRWLKDSPDLGGNGWEDASNAAAGGAGVGVSAADRKQQKRDQAEARKRLQPMKKELRKLESELDKLSTEQQAMEAELADSTLYEPEAKQRLTTLLADKGRVDQRLEEVEERWLELSEQLAEAEG